MVKKAKAKRTTKKAPSAYNLFVKKNWNRKSLAHLEPKSRMAELGSMWSAGDRDTTTKRTKRTKKGKGFWGEAISDVGGLAQKYGKYIPF